MAVPGEAKLMTNGLRKSCVIGWPAGHSRSPMIHNYWLKQHGLTGEYDKHAVAPEDFPAFIASLAANGYAGANVTIPHKVTALHLSKPDARAKAVGAANTLWYQDGELHSTNTDVEGFLANLDDVAPHWIRGHGRALVLGAGGAAHAVVFGLIARGVTQIRVANRHRERAEALKAQFGPAVDPVDWDKVEEMLPTTDVLVNATSLGMKGMPDVSLDVGLLPSSAIVVDLVYSPLVTTLLGAAKARGLVIGDGLGMLLHQAVRGFSLWFGVQPHVTHELRALIEADLARS
jgi:shikimate dehydrogenase